MPTINRILLSAVRGVIQGVWGVVLLLWLLNANSAQAQFGPNLLVRYTFPEGSGTVTRDATANALDLTLGGVEGSVSLTSTGLYNAGASSSDTGVAVNTATGMVFDNLKAYTITGWYNDCGTPTTKGRLVMLTNAAGTTWTQLYLVNQDMIFQANDAANSYTTHSDAFPGTGWTFFAVTVDSSLTTLSSAVKIYKGTQTSSATVITGTVGTGTGTALALGDIEAIALGNKWNAGTTTSSSNYSLESCYLDDVRVYAGALTATDVETVRASVDQRLLVRYSFDEGSGTTVADSGPYGLNLTLSGGMTWPASMDNSGPWGSYYPLYNPSTSNSGKQNARNTATGTVFNNIPKYTITGWYNDCGTATTNGRFVTLGNATNSNFLQVTYGAQDITFQVNTSSNVIITTTDSFPATGWNFFAVTVDSTVSTLSGAVKIYRGTESMSVTPVNCTRAGVTSTMALSEYTAISVGNMWSAGDSGGTTRSLETCYVDDIRVYSGALSQATLEEIRNKAPGEGPQTKAMREFTETDKANQRTAGTALRSAISAAATAQVNYTATKGDYRFNPATSSAAITMTGPPHQYNNITIDFNGSTLWFDVPNIGFNLINGNQNLTIKNATLDWDPLPFVQGRVVNVQKTTSPRYYDIMLDPGYYRATTYLGPDSASYSNSWRGTVIDPKTRQIKLNSRSVDTAFAWTNRNADGSYRVNDIHNLLSASTLAVGDLVAISRDGSRAFCINGATNLNLTNLSVYSSPFVAFCQGGGSRTTFSGCKIIRRPGTNRLISANADGINVANASQGPLIDGCRIENTEDDGVNIHGLFGRVVSGSGATPVVSSPKIVTSGAEPVSLMFIDIATKSLIGTASVSGVTTTNYTITADNCLADLTDPWNANANTSSLTYSSTNTVQVLTMSPQLIFTADTAIQNDATCCPYSVLQNTTIIGTRGRGVRWQTPGSATTPGQILNNKISNTSLQGIILYSAMGYWGEAGTPHDVVLSGNTFTDCYLAGGGTDSERAAILSREGMGPYSATPILSNISITNNTFVRPGNQAIVARGIKGLTITGNSITSWGNVPANSWSSTVLPGDGYGIVSDTNQNTTILNNTFSSPGTYAVGQSYP